MDRPAEKKKLREAARGKRAQLAASIPDHAEQLAQHADVLKIPEKSLVGGYAALPTEANPHVLLKQLLLRGHALAYPRVSAKDAPLVFHYWSPNRELRRGAFGVPEPASDWPVAYPKILLVPLLAFDAHGYRLGYGGGYYDQTLRALRNAEKIMAIGIAFDGQYVARLPHDDWDEKLDFVVTEKGVRAFA